MSESEKGTAEFQALLSEAMTAHRRGDPQARALVARAWTRARNRVDELFPLAQAFQALGDVSGLKDVETALMRMDGKRPRVALAHGRVLRMLGEHRAAVPLLRRAVKRGPKIVDTHIALTGLLLDMGDAAGALRAGRAGLALHPQNLALRLNTLRAQVAVDVRAVDLDELTRLVGDGPRRAPSHRLRLQALRQLRRLDEAHEAVEAFAKACPGDCDAAFERAGLELLAGDPRAAKTRLTFALTEEPPHLDRLARLGQASVAAGNTEAAEQVLTRMKSLPVTAASVAAQGRLTLQCKDHAAALALFRQSLSLDPRQFGLWAQTLDVMTQLGRGTEALALFDDAPAPVRTRPEVLVKAAQAARGTGQLGRAMALLEDPAAAEGGPVFRHYVEALCQQGRVREARKLLTGMTPASGSARADQALGLAQAAREEFDYAEVVRQSRIVTEEDPTRPGGWWQLAHACLLTCQPDAAMAAWKQMIAINKGHGNRTMKHQGTLLWHKAEEMQLHPEMTAALAAAWEQDPKTLAETASAYLRAGEDNIGPALSLLIAQRRMGALEAGETGRSPIPQKIHQYWEGPMPKDLASALDQMAQLNPEDEHRLWNRADARAFLQTRGDNNVVRAFDLARHAAERADIFRLSLLLHEGGVYIDADDLCRAPVRTLIPAGAETVLFQEYHGAIANNFVATIPGNEVLAWALNSAVEETILGAATSIWLRTGPGLVTRALAKAMASQGNTILPNWHIHQQSAMNAALVICAPFSYKLDHRHWMKLDQPV